MYRVSAIFFVCRASAVASLASGTGALVTMVPRVFSVHFSCHCHHCHDLYHDIWWPFYQHGLTFIPAWISNHILSKVQDEINYLFPNFSGSLCPFIPPSIHPSVHPSSHIPCPACSTYSSGWILLYLYILSSNFRRCVMCIVVCKITNNLAFFLNV